MNKYEILTSKGPLDTSGNDNLSFNFSIKDILDITSRTNAYSKTIVLPGSPTNNQFFAYLYDVNINNISFNALKRIGVYIKVGSEMIMKGYMQLLNIQNDNGEISYEVSVFGVLKNLITSFGDNVLNSLDLSEYDHNRSIETVMNSWEYKVPENGTLKSYGEGGNGFVYPYIINGNSQDIANYLYLYDLYPAVYARTLMYKLAQWGGYTVTSNFLDSDYYRKIIILYVGDKIQMSDDEKNQRLVVVGTTPTNGDYDYNLMDFVNHSSYYKSQDNNYKIKLNREYGTVSDSSGELVFRDSLGQWDVNTNKLTVAKTGRYDIDFYGTAFLLARNHSTVVINYDGGNFEYTYDMILKRKNGSTSILSSSKSTAYPNGIIKFSLNDSSKHPVSDWLYEDTPIVFNMTASNVLLEQGDIIVIQISLQHKSDVEWGNTNNKNVQVKLVWKRSYSGSYTYLKMEPSVDQSYGDDAIKMTSILSSTKKMKDFFLDQCKMFNLVVMENPNKENDLLIEPEEDFYVTKQKVIDMDQYLDYNQTIKLTPMSEVNAKTFKFTYTQDDDFYNKGYTDETKRIFGDFEMEIDNDFSDTIQTIQIGFASTPCGNLNITSGNRYAPFFIDQDIKSGLKPKKVKDRILFYNGLTSLSNNKLLRLKNHPASTSATTLTSYPAASMWDDVFNPVYTLEFGRLSKVYFDNDGISPNQNLFEKFYKSTTLNIIDKNATLLEAKFILTTKMISEFDFRDIWFIQGQYWRVNEIKDYNPIEGNELTTVVLYKIINLDILSKYQVYVPTSNNSCPSDVALKKINIVESVYYSKSGQAIGADCCKQLGGNFVNGMCKVAKYVEPNKPPYHPSPWTLPAYTDSEETFNPTGWWTNGPSWLSNIVNVNGGWDMIPVQEPYGPLTKNNWMNSQENTNIFVNGSQNHSNDESYNGFIVGDNNTIVNGITNAIVFGSNIIASQSNTVYLNNSKIGPDGLIRHSGLYIIDGGLNEVFNVNKTNPIEVIDGTFNSVRNPGGDSWARMIIDGNGELNND